MLTDQGYVLVFFPSATHRKLIAANLLARGYPTVEVGTITECEAVAGLQTPSLVIYCRFPMLSETDLTDIRACDHLAQIPLATVSTSDQPQKVMVDWDIKLHCKEPFDFVEMIGLLAPYLPPSVR